MNDYLEDTERSHIDEGKERRSNERKRTDWCDSSQKNKNYLISTIKKTSYLWEVLLFTTASPGNWDGVYNSGVAKEKVGVGFKMVVGL